MPIRVTALFYLRSIEFLNSDAYDGSNSSMKSHESKSGPAEVYTPLKFLLHLGAQCYVAIGDFFDKARIGVTEHDMEVLYGVYRLQRPPVLEPDNLSSVSKQCCSMNT